MKINGKDFLIGADPELFLRKDGVPFSAYNMVEGTKEKPRLVKGGAVQVDGMALEFNINPAKTYKTFSSNIQTVMDELRLLVPAEYEFDVSPSITFDDDTIDSQPMAALELGCSPDYNAYTGKKNDKPHTQSGFRTAAGHIHIGWTEGLDPMEETHFEACKLLAQQLDVHLGMPSLLWDKDTTRRELYGAGGAFRPKPYGMEYRTISNAWLKSEGLITVVWKQTIRAIQQLLGSGGAVNNYGFEIEEAINSGNESVARTLSGHLLNSEDYAIVRGT